MSKKRQKSAAGGEFGDGSEPDEAGDHAASSECSPVRNTSLATASPVPERTSSERQSLS